MKLAIILCFLCMFAAYAAQSASLYRWVDAQGNVHYTDQPPPAGAKEVEEKKVTTAPPEDAPLPYATRTAARNFPVTLFNSPCGEVCAKAREHLTRRGIPFTEKDAGLPENADALRKVAGSVEVPVLVIGRTAPLKGYEPGQWDIALDAAGYPRGNPLPAERSPR
jgi:glutaredoxin